MGSIVKQKFIVGIISTQLNLFSKKKYCKLTKDCVELFLYIFQIILKLFFSLCILSSLEYTFYCLELLDTIENNITQNPRYHQYPHRLNFWWILCEKCMRVVNNRKWKRRLKMICKQFVNVCGFSLRMGLHIDAHNNKKTFFPY